LAYTARRVFKQDADLLEAKRLYEESFAAWKKAFDAFPDLEIDSPTGSDLMDYIEQYSTVLQQLDLNLTDDEVGSKFPLWAVVAANDSSQTYLEGVRKFLKGDDPSEPTTPEADSDEPAGAQEPLDERAEEETNGEDAAEAETAPQDAPGDDKASDEEASDETASNEAA